MKKIIALLLALVMMMSLVACGPKDNGDTYKITMWVSESDGVADQVKEQIARFNETNEYGLKFEVAVEGVSEANAASQVLADVASAPDIYCFAQDQLARLVQASALAAPSANAAATIKANNDNSAIAAGSVGGSLWAYPMTSDNGYYLYYNTSIFSEEDVKDLATMVAKCEAANLKFRFALENAWYNAAFFFATGCHSNWTTNEKGQFVSVDDTFSSANGLIAMKGMQILAKSPCYDSDADSFLDAAAIVTGTWNAKTAAEHFGDNLGATKLPSFTVDGQTYQLGSYSGNKLMGVKPQQDAEKQAALHLLAQYLTNEECQLERFNSFGWGPSNLKAQANDAVKADPSLSALAAQGQFATPQGNIGGPFWDNVGPLGAVAKNATSDDELQAGLDNYAAAVEKFVSLTPEQRESYTVIGAVGGTMWDTDFEMKQDPAGTWTSKEAFELAAGAEFKVRLGMDWKVAYGNNEHNADASNSNRGNYIVETAGKYYIQLVLAEDGTAVINLIAA